jgi:hypothetical protein
MVPTAFTRELYAQYGMVEPQKVQIILSTKATKATKATKSTK